METIGSFEAKTHWSALLQKVTEGEEIIITRRGKAIARLVPEVSTTKTSTDDIITRLRTLRQQCSLHGDDWKAWRDEGRE